MIRKKYRMRYNGRLIYSQHPTVTLAIDERSGRTYAKAEMQWGDAHLAGRGVAYRHPSDCLTRASGEEAATARALSDLAEQVTALRRIKA